MRDGACHSCAGASKCYASSTRYAARHLVKRANCLPGGCAVGSQLPMLPAQKQGGLVHVEGGDSAVERLQHLYAALLRGHPHPHCAVLGRGYDVLAVAAQRKDVLHLKQGEMQCRQAAVDESSGGWCCGRPQYVRAPAFRQPPSSGTCRPPPCAAACLRKMLK